MFIQEEIYKKNQSGFKKLLSSGLPTSFVLIQECPTNDKKLKFHLTNDKFSAEFGLKNNFSNNINHNN